MSKAVVNNFGKVTVSTTYNGSATSIVLTTGHGAKLPSTFPYYLVWYDSTTYPDPADDPNVEIVKVTARSTDTLTVARGQDGTSGSTKSTAGKTYRMVLAPIKAIHDDLYNMMRGMGCGRFTFSSSTVCLFSPYKGNTITINGQVETIPSGTVSFSNSGLVSSTLYYAYVYMSSGTMTGEFSTTGHSTDTSSGQEIKTGDASRTLVGMIYTSGTGTFEASANVQHVATYFNRGWVSCMAYITGDLTYASSSFGELSTSLRVDWLSWGDSTSIFRLGGGMKCNTAGNQGWALTLDSLVAASAAGSAYVGTNGAAHSVVANLSSVCSEGRHYGTILVAAEAGTATYYGNDANLIASGRVRYMVENFC